MGVIGEGNFYNKKNRLWLVVKNVDNRILRVHYFVLLVDVQ
jgi:hypothetical protein